MRFGCVVAAAIACALSMSSAAQAVTLNVGGAASVASGSPSIYEVNFDFLLPAGFSGAQLNITNLAADDRGVLKLNGLTINSTGIDVGAGLNGSFDFGLGAGNQPFTFAAFNGARNLLVNSGFVTGTNMLRLIVNDTNAGITGAPLAGGVNISGYSLAGTVTFNAATGGVPEPGTWVMMLMGFGGLGAVLRRRRNAEAALAA